MEEAAILRHLDTLDPRGGTGVVHVQVVRGFLKFIMYLGGVMAVVAFILPYWDGKPAGIDLPPQAQPILTWGGLGLVIVGYMGRRLIDPDS